MKAGESKRVIVPKTNAQDELIKELNTKLKKIRGELDSTATTSSESPAAGQARTAPTVRKPILNAQTVFPAGFLGEIQAAMQKKGILYEPTDSSSSDLAAIDQEKEPPRSIPKIRAPKFKPPNAKTVAATGFIEELMEKTEKIRQANELNAEKIEKENRSKGL
jgi:hypothetical protein